MPNSDQRQLLWHLAAALATCVCLAILFADLYKRGFADHVLAPRRATPLLTKLNSNDAIYHAGLVGRNAYALLSNPLRFWDAEHCAPAEKTLTLGHSFFTMSLIAAPFLALTGDPIVAHNAALLILFALPLVGFLMLPRSWMASTSVAAAFGVLFSFHATRVLHPAHLIVFDYTWALLAAACGHKVLQTGSWRAASACTLFIALQMGASWYAFMGSLLLLLPLALWLMWSKRRVARSNTSRLAGIAAGSLAAALLLYGPYLGAPQRLIRTGVFFLLPGDLLPGGQAFPGWVPLIGVSGFLFAARSRGRRAADHGVAVALLVGSLLAVLVAAGPVAGLLRLGPFHVPDLYSWIAEVVPGMRTGRGVRFLAFAGILGLHIAGAIGTATLLRRLQRVPRQLAEVALLLAAAGCAAMHCWEARQQQVLVNLRPTPAVLQFYAELERLGNRGPIFELPFDHGIGRFVLSPGRIVLTAFHHRRTSACYAGFIPSIVENELSELARRLPEESALRRLRELGFTTLIVHLDLGPSSVAEWKRLRPVVARRAGLRPLYITPRIAALELGDPSVGARPPAPFADGVPRP